MKIVLNLLLWLSIGVGSFGAASAYLVPIDDDRAIGLTLNAPAGGRIEEGRLVALASPGTKITAELLQNLRGNRVTFEGEDRSVEFVRVREFDLARWPGKWLFLAGCAGLLVAALGMRLMAHKDVARTREVHESETPEYALKQIHEITLELAEADAATIVTRLGEVQQVHVPAFADGRGRLIARLGMTGFAELMDRFAAAERQLNRAWSAAADDVLEEAHACLGLAATLLAATRAHLESL